MACINPLTINQKSNGAKQSFEVPCGHCLPCLIKKQSQLTFLAQKELLTRYRKNQSASFVTLTYDDNHLPLNDKGYYTLRRSDLQKFIKNMRRQIEYYNMNLDFKFIYCGEYGDGSHSSSKTGISTNRPHYHIAFLGLSPEQVRLFTRKLWRFGLCDIGVLTSGGLRYICKYMTKACPDKDVKELREKFDVQNPFIYHSIGIGKEWIQNHIQKIVDDDFTFSLNGKKYLFPKYVLQYVGRKAALDYRVYVRKFIKETGLRLAKAKGVSYSDYDFEKNFLHYQYMVAALRSQNKPINDITTSKAWCRPKHFLDRSPYEQLACKALELGRYGDIVPF